MEKMDGSQKSGRIESYTVKAGDTLLSIAERIYGDDSIIKTSLVMILTRLKWG